MTRLGISLALLIALALAARFTPVGKTVRASSQPTTPVLNERTSHPSASALD